MMLEVDRHGVGERGSCTHPSPKVSVAATSTSCSVDCRSAEDEGVDQHVGGDGEHQVSEPMLQPGGAGLGAQVSGN